MKITEELPELPERYRWGIEPAGTAIRFGVQSNGMRRDGVLMGYLGTWFWLEHKYITVEPEDDDAEILREMKLQAESMRDRLLEEIRAGKEKQEKAQRDEEIRRQKAAKVQDFLERNL